MKAETEVKDKVIARHKRLRRLGAKDLKMSVGMGLVYINGTLRGDPLQVAAVLMDMLENIGQLAGEGQLCDCETCRTGRANRVLN